MEASNYKQPLELIKKELIIDEQGMENEEFVTILRFRGYVNNLSGKEYWEAKQINSETSLKVYTYYCKLFSTINTKDYFIKFNNKIYDIQFIDNIQYQNREIQFKIIKKG